MVAGLLFLVMVLLFKAGEYIGKLATLEKIKMYIKKSKDWNEFMEKLSVDFNNYDIEP